MAESLENTGARVLFISPGIGYDNEIGTALADAGVDVDTVYRAVHMPLPRHEQNINVFGFVSWEAESAPDWGEIKPDVIASCGIVKKFEGGELDLPPITYDARGLAELSGAAYVDLAPGVMQTIKSVMTGNGVPRICEADAAVERVQGAIAALKK
jgi:hypothetical protein